MVRNVMLVRDDDLLDFAKALMDWYGFERLPVENTKGQIRGVITSNDISEFESSANEHSLVSECMTSDVLTVPPERSLEKAEKIMIANGIGSLPVVRDDRVIGILTSDDIRRVRNGQND